MIQQFDSLMQMMDVFSDEQVCIDHLRAIRWKDGAFCPYCACRRIYNFKDGRTHKCGDCRKRFSIKVGTIFEDTKLPLRKWFAAIWLITSHKKGIASTQLAKDIKITQKSAWFVLHRLRHAARTKSFNRPLDGEVEADETFVGGKAKNKHADKRTGKRGTADKIVVAGVLQRGGNVVAKVVPDTSAKSLHPFVRDHVSTNAVLLATDELTVYRALGKEFAHRFVRHSDGEYVRDNVHTNGMEGFWSQLKRQIVGIHHWISAKHLDRYVGEASWRFNERKSGEGERVNNLLAIVGGRLTYTTLIA